jgi:hypothetical protein
MATYDIEALKADLPTAKELAQFVYDRTQLSLDLIGKSKEDQYLVAKNALEGKKVPAEYITDENPYVDRKEQIPVDEVRKLPERSKDLPPEDALVHFFGATNMPHPLDPQSDKKVGINFKKYNSGLITYQVMGPLEQIAVGTKVNRYGQEVPERYSWIDPRTEELVMRNPDGTFTQRGQGLYTFLIGEKGGGIWGLIDKDMVRATAKNIADPWA